MKQPTALFLFITITGLSGCASKSTSESIDQTQNSANTSPNTLLKTSDQPRDKNRSQTLKEDSTEDIVSYFYKLYPKGSGKPVSGLHLQDLSAENGYLKATGHMEGYFVFALFKGKTADYIIEQSTGCGPECEQSFKVHTFQNGNLVKTESLDAYYRQARVKAHFSKMRSRLSQGRTSLDQDIQSWIRLPKSGSSADLLLLERNLRSKTDEVRVYEIGVLPWNGDSFEFQPLSPKSPSDIQFSGID